MPQHHIDALEHALLQKGWKISSSGSPEIIPSDSYFWLVDRGSASLTIDFNHYGHLGEHLPFSESWACSVYCRNRRAHLNLHLYFWKSPRFERELRDFMRKLDDA